VYEPGVGTTTTTFDDRGRFTGLKRADGSRIDVSFSDKDGSSNKITLTDSQGKQTAYVPKGGYGGQWVNENNPKEPPQYIHIDGQSGKLTMTSDVQKPPPNPGEWRPLTDNWQKTETTIDKYGKKEVNVDKVAKLTYNNGNHLSEINYANGASVKFGYGKDGQVTSVGFDNGKLTRQLDEKSGKYTDKWVDEQGKVRFEGDFKVNQKTGEYSAIQKGVETVQRLDGKQDVLNTGKESRTEKVGDKIILSLSKDGSSRVFSYGDAKSKEPTAFKETRLNGDKVESQTWVRKSGDLWRSQETGEIRRVTLDKDGQASYSDKQTIQKGWTNSKGEVLRTRDEKGREWVYSKDDNGKPYVQEDKKIDKLPHNPFVDVPEWRQKQLDKVADDLMKKHIKNEKIDFKGIADLMDDIAKNPGLTEREKTNVWSKVAQKRGADFPVSTDGANPDTLDSFNSNDVWHAVITFADGYHAPMAHDSPEDARKKIERHELAGQLADQLRVGPFTGPNKGDITASTYQVEALREFLKSGFSGYAQKWRENFTR
jgi:hypothetical protein